jgi:bifunctional non-homologous end joining protein LigD
MDGTRAMILANDKAIHGINKLGLVTGLPDPVVQAVRRFVRHTGGMLFLDAERIKDTFHVFDVLIAEGNDLRDEPAGRRAVLIESLVERLDCPLIRSVLPFFGLDSKSALFESIRGRNGEGMVFKEVRSPYVAGLAKNGTQFKYKFYKQVTVQVVGLNDGKRSARIAMFEADGTPVEVGNVTIPLNASMPHAGDFLEVRYLYGTGNRKLFQPVYSFARTDVTQADAAISKMVLKPEGSDD